MSYLNLIKDRCKVSEAQILMRNCCLNTSFKSKRVFFCQLQLNITMVIVRIKMVCSNITVNNDEAGFKHNSNEVIIF